MATKTTIAIKILFIFSPKLLSVTGCANKGAPGVDGITIEEFPDKTRPLWGDIRASLATGSYQPKPVLRVEIPKPTGGTRPLGIPTVLDRLIQQSIAQILTPIFDPDFSSASFGFRPHRSAHQAEHWN
jgi:RNA-directed DNA polymerase